MSIESLKRQIESLQRQNSELRIEIGKLERLAAKVTQAQRKMASQRADFDQSMYLENDALFRIDYTVPHRHTLTFSESFKDGFVGGASIKRRNSEDAFDSIQGELARGYAKIIARIAEARRQIAANNETIKSLQAQIRALRRKA